MSEGRVCGKHLGTKSHDERCKSQIFVHTPMSGPIGKGTCGSNSCFLRPTWLGLLQQMAETVATALCDLRRNLRSVQRQKSRLEGLQTRGMAHPLRRMLICTLIACLSNDDALARMWTSMDQRRRGRSGNGNYAVATMADVTRWRLQYGTHGDIVRASQELDHPLRREADDFLMESLTVEAIEKQSGKGLVVPGAWVMETYVRLWRHRPRCRTTEDVLLRLETEERYRNKWAWNFRRRWRLRCGEPHGVRSVSATGQRHRAAIFIRWAKWLRDQSPSGRRLVVINMDETAISERKHNSRGTWMHSAGLDEHGPEGKSKLQGFPRCCLIACITDDAGLQSHLPQVFLPRTPRSGVPSVAVRGVFANAAYPIEAWHGSSGWNVLHTMKTWLRAVESVARHHRPGCSIIMVLDAYSVHASLETARLCRALGIRVLYVPSGMTWLLQPLDTHVFSQLKRRMRKRMLRKRLDSETGKLAWSDALECATFAVREDLVHKTWCTAMSRAGLQGEADAVAAKLKTSFSDMDLTSRPPSLQELGTLLGRQGPTTTLLHTALLEPLSARRNSAHSSSATTPAVGHGTPGSSTDHHRTMDGEAASSTRVSHAPRPAGNRLWLPRGRRLFFPRRGNVRLDASSEPSIARVHTRSQRRPLWPGVLETEQPSRRRRLLQDSTQGDGTTARHPTS